MRLQYQSGWVQSLFTKQHPLPLWQDYTWFFQGIMPLMGYLGGIEVFGWIGTYAPYDSVYLSTFNWQQNDF